MLAVLAANAEAQNIPDSLVTKRVQLHLVLGERGVEGFGARQLLRGTALRIGTDSITLLVHKQASPITVAVGGIRQIDVSRGVRRSHSALHRGFEAALIWGLAPLKGDRSNEEVAAWAAAGFVFGGIIGALLPHEQWKRVLRQ